jgi:hypothetical protein
VRKSIALKTILRSPLKTILTFAFIAAASFALFSRVIGYAVTVRETARAESFYSGVAALDNAVPDVTLDEDNGSAISYGVIYDTEDKPWPTKEQLEKFSSLPGVTLADTRYMTAGLVEDYRRLAEEGSGQETNRCLFEGTYAGYDKDEYSEDFINLKFEDITLLAGDIDLDLEKPTIISALAIEDTTFFETPFKPSFFEQLDKGSRCLVLGNYNALSGDELKLDDQSGKEALRVIDGLPDGYLETEAFAFHKGVLQAINQSVDTFDIVYTKDTRAIPRFNERNMVLAEGRPLMTGDTEGCVVSKLFMETYNLTLGDKVSIQLGDRLFRQNGRSGAKPRDAEKISNFVDTVELEIIGVYQFTDTPSMRMLEDRWSYTSSTIFVPVSLLPVEVPDDYESPQGEFSVFIENAYDIEAFYAAAEPLAQEMDVALRFSDGGWLSVKDSFGAGARTMLLTTILYLAGAVLALLLAVYLYISRNKKVYAIMRSQGVPAVKACCTIALPLGVLAVPAIIVGGVAGILHASTTTMEALESIAAVTADTVQGYTLNKSLPIEVVLLSLFSELLFITFITLIFLMRVVRMPLLELLQDNVVKAGADSKAPPTPTRSKSVLETRANMEVYDRSETAQRGKYGALRQVTAYILRHIRRGTGKTSISLILTIVLTAGIGLFVLARLTYQDAFRETEVNGKALEFSSSSIINFSKSKLMDNFYCYGNVMMLINGQELNYSITVTNNLERYLSEDYTVTYANGFDDTLFTGSGQVCLLGQKAAEIFGVRPGDEISVLPYDLYLVLTRTNDNSDTLQAAVEQATSMYEVAGIILSDQESINNGIFAAVNSDAEAANGQPFPIEYSEFTLSDNEKLDELSDLLNDQKVSDKKDAPMASFYLNSAGLENIRRVRDLLNLLFPVAVTAAVLIGVLGPGLLIMQSAREAAYLRILGVTKKRVRCMLVFEQIVLCAVGIAVVSGGLALYDHERLIRSADTLAVCGVLYLLGCVCGALGASILVTRRRALELLQVKE